MYVFREKASGLKWKGEDWRGVERKGSERIGLEWSGAERKGFSGCTQGQWSAAPGREDPGWC